MGDKNFYAHWREQHFADLLRENDPVPPESLLQAVWHHQRLLRDRLKTADGRALQVLHPGFWNRESGPDFRGAVLKIDDDVHTGDIEIDLHHAGWRGHGHHRNPAFSKVALHVVWECAGANADLPVLTLKPFLDAPLKELKSWFGGDAPHVWPAALSGRCCAPLRGLSEPGLIDLVHQAAAVRLERKAREFELRSRQVGWEQALREGLLRALGYKHNVWPMQRIGELLPELLRDSQSVLDLQARLLGVSGLLPADVNRKANAEYVRRIWDAWWRERERLGAFVLPKAVWRLHGLRPANHPQRRLALAAHWFNSKGFMPALAKWFADETPKSASAAALLRVLQVDCDEFWSWHWSLNSPRMPKPQPLIGSSRVTDLAVNVILPWFWMRAVAGRNAKARELTQKRYFAWDAAEDNSILKLARNRLLGAGRSRLLRTAAQQQGLLQIVRDFCEHSNAICANCRFPDLVRQWSTSGPVDRQTDG